MRTELELQWVEALAVDHGKVDDQHRTLFALYNRVVRVPEGQINRSELMDTLLDYARIHFADEEAIMEEARYPEAAIKSHRQHHREFFQRLDELKDRPVYQTLDFVREWLLRHVMSEDLVFGRFLKQANQNGAG